MKKLAFLLVAMAMALVACQSKTQELEYEQILSEGWTLRGDTLDIQLNVTVPSVVQTDLYAAGLIPHPYLGQVENDLLWISDHPWRYSLHFDADENILKNKFVDLVFEGIDTYADVVLNGEKLFSADNMFRRWTVPVSLLAKDNVLEVNFVRYDSLQLAMYEQTMPRFPEKYAMNRKAAYQHGWDWAPKYKNVGIWQPVKLVAWSGVRIDDARVVTVQADSLLAEMKLMVELCPRFDCKHHEVTLQVCHEGQILQSQDFNLDESLSLAMPFSVKQPKLWWPNEMGEQALYDFDVFLYVDDNLLDTKKIRTGIKTFEMVQEPDEKGSSFYFKVNGKPIYAKGANYIPQDNFTSWMRPEVDLDLLQKSKAAHFNMLRIWGGGIYPFDSFYDICDSLGILVWEDFMYAGTMYPYDTAFLRNARVEAEEQVRRLASHPSLALWCGGNEISEGYYNWGWQQSLNWSEEDDRAMKAGYDALFEGILPEAVAKYDGTRPYWPSSPSKGWGRPESLTEGDVHYWGVWWGELPYEIYREKVGRFNSEYGYQSYPDLATLQMLDPDATLEVGCDLLEAHQKHARGTRQIDDFIQKYYPKPQNFSEYVYMSQLSQAYGMEIAIEAHRTAKPYNMGTLYWQLNDSWPVASWSSIDHYGHKKALQYKLGTLFAPILLSLDTKDKAIFVTSDCYKTVCGTLKAEVKDFKGKVLFENSMKVDVAEFQSVRFVIEGLKAFLKSVSAKDVFVKLQLLDDEEILAERYCYLAYPKDLKLAKATIATKHFKENSQWVLELSSDVLAKDVALRAHGVDGDFSDNFFDLDAGITKRVVFTPEQDTEEVTFEVWCLNEGR